MQLIRLNSSLLTLLQLLLMSLLQLFQGFMDEDFKVFNKNYNTGFLDVEVLNDLMNNNK